jgi:ketosteroid isomerase-like protein
VPEESTTSDLKERVRTLLELGGRGDWDTAMEYFAPRAVWVAVDGLETFEGDAIRDFWVEWYEPYHDVRIEPVEIVDLGGGVVMAILRQSGRLRDSPSRLEEHVALVYRWSNGLIERVSTHIDIDEARAAAEQLAQEG